ncbi:ABC transporter substrate-binding protein [Methylopila musalis]|uniref:ABC transporter substrate-binding protein n=1 Tax=Methylopila musalis TaxID=1134781 RepID=A0ABW3ZAE6_9HYPH
MRRRDVVLGGLALAGLGVPARAAAISVVDQAGRTVTLDRPARRLILSDGIDLIALGLIHDRPAELLVGWNATWLDADTLATLEAADARLAAVPKLGAASPDALPIENLIRLEPDLVVLSPYFAAHAAGVAALERAGIAVAVLQPSPSLRDGAQGLALLGALIGRAREAEAYLSFFRERSGVIRDRLATAGGARPSVLLEAHAGAGTCCLSPGRGQSIGDLVAAAGGRNIGDGVIAGMAGQLSLEYVLAAEPQVYVGTGGAYLAGRGGLVLGPRRAADEARASLARALARPGLSEIPAIRDGRAYGLWHDLARSALNLVALEALARWIRPDLFGDLDPQATLDHINARLSAIPVTGALWVEARR